MTHGPSPFVHQALPYRSDEEFVEQVVAFARAGVAAREPVLAALPGPRLQQVNQALGVTARRIQMVDLTVAGRNPGWIIPGVLRMFADAYARDPGRVRIISEAVWPARSAMEYPACVQHEALVNMAFSGRRVTILCPYDASRLSPMILADAATTHSALLDTAGERPSRAYAPDRILRTYNQPLVVPPEAAVFDFNLGNVAGARSFASTHALQAGLPQFRAGDLELAIGELAANSIRHGGGHGTLGVWGADGHVVCEIRDSGHLTDPLAGRRPVDLSVDGGRGLLLANQLADLVRLYTSPHGTVVRLHYKR